MSGRARLLGQISGADQWGRSSSRRVVCVWTHMGRKGATGLRGVGKWGMRAR